jgi:hypothetical protein
MPVTFVTPLMNLTLPTVGPSGQVGPTFATNLNEAFELVDSHDHSTGKGTRISQNGINITGDLDINESNLLDVKSTRYDSQDTDLVGASDVNCVYVVDGELVYNDASGTAVQITEAGSINVSSLGTIGGDYSTSDASVIYTDSSKIFLFKQDGTKTADMAFGSIFMYENIAAANYVKIKSAASLVANIEITLPAALPGSTLPVTLSATGVLATGQIATAQIADLAVTTAKIADLNVTTAKIAALNVTRAKLEAVGQQISSSSGAFSTTALFTAPADVTNLTVTITTTGRPVFIGLISDGSASYSALGVGHASNTAVSAVAFILRGASIISNYFYSSFASLYQIPSSSVFVIDPVAAGTYTYKVQQGVITGTTAYCDRVKLVAYEL